LFNNPNLRFVVGYRLTKGWLASLAGNPAGFNAPHFLLLLSGFVQKLKFLNNFFLKNKARRRP
jgi:hypothetical protein